MASLSPDLFPGLRVVFQKTIHYHLMKNSALILFTIILLITFQGCSLKEVKKTFPDINQVLVNEKFRINLPENHNDGYTWNLRDDYDKKILTNSNTVWHGNTKGLDFNFQALAAGQTTLTFVKRKYTDTADFKQFIVQILAK
jgi:predicted secreted protein